MAYGAIWAQAELRKILRMIGASVEAHELAVAYAQHAFCADGRLRGPEQRVAVDIHPPGARRATLPTRRLTLHTDADLYLRGAATLLASWAEYARGATDAALQRLPGVAAAVFPHEPERSVYNNALLERRLSARERTDALDAMNAAYATAGVERFAAWVHESDRAMQHDLARRGYRLDTTTRAMGLILDEASLPRPQIELAPPDWREHLRIAEVPPGFLANADPAAYRVALACLGGGSVATAMAYEFDGDCGIYNVGTLEHARRRGLGTGVTVVLLQEALARGVATASLQATAMAERLYAALGFRDLGRILEYVPPASSKHDTAATGRSSRAVDSRV